jgi:hypothetical protein
MLRLYFFLPFVTDFSVGNNEEWDAVSEILAYSYKLHECHLTAQAMKLYDLISGLLNGGWARNPIMKAILCFLANLAGEVQVCAWDSNVKVSPFHLHESCTSFYDCENAIW